MTSIPVWLARFYLEVFVIEIASPILYVARSASMNYLKSLKNMKKFALFHVPVVALSYYVICPRGGFQVIRGSKDALKHS